MKGFVLRRDEVFLLTQTVVGFTFRVLRALGPTWRDNIQCPEHERAAMIRAMVRVGPYPVGSRYYVKENFAVAFQPDRNQSWITFKADREVAGCGPIHGQTGFPNGEYSPVMMKEYMTRCRVMVEKVEVVFEMVAPQPGHAARQEKPKMQWAWAIHLQRKAR